MPDFPPTVSPDEILDGWMDYGIFSHQVRFLRSHYALLSLEWFQDYFPRSFQAFRERLMGLPEYRENNLCIDFSKDSIFWATVLNRHTRGDAALAIGECIYTPDKPGPDHFIAVGAYRDGKSILPVFFEPQRPAVISLTWNEIGTASIRME